MNHRTSKHGQNRESLKSKSTTRAAESKIEQAANKKWNSDGFIGTGVVYFAHPMRHGMNVEITMSDYEIDLDSETREEQLRYARRTQVKAPAELCDVLQDEVLVIFGPDVSPRVAIKALRRIIESIKGTGLLIGRNENGDLVWEMTDGTEIT
jgi:hypothetical protein